jgi:hypothetical protein
MTDKGKRLLDIVTAIRNVAREHETEWPKSLLENPTITTVQADLYSARIYDTGCLKQGAQTIEAMVNKADAWSSLFLLAVRNPAAFDAIVVLAEIELAREPAKAAA